MGRGERRGTLRYGVVCRQQIVLGGLDRGWEGLEGFGKGRVFMGWGKGGTE